jgi:TP901 family phage tail tape measure protein
VSEELAFKFIGYNLLSGVISDILGSLKGMAAEGNAARRQFQASQDAMAADSLAAQAAIRSSRAETLANQEQYVARSVAADEGVIASRRRTSQIDEELLAQRRENLANAELSEEQYSAKALQLAKAEESAARFAMQTDQMEMNSARQLAANEENTTRQRLGLINQEIAARQQQAALEERAAQREKAAQEETRASIQAASQTAMVAGGIMVAASAGIAAGMYESAKAAMNFDSQITLLSTHARATVPIMNSLRDWALNSAGALGYDPVSLAQAAYHVQSAFTSLPPALQNATGEEQILTAAAKLAQIGHADLSDTVNAMIGVMTSYGKTMTDASAAAGELNTIVGEGNMRMQDLNVALGSGLLPVAKTAGVALWSLGAAIATMTDQNVGASRAAIYMRSAIIQMSEPSNKAADALSAIGVAAGDTAKMVDGFSQVLENAGVNQSEVAAKLAKTGSIGQTLVWLQGLMEKNGLTAQQTGALLETAFGGIRSGVGVISLTNNLQGLVEKELDAKKGGEGFAETWQYFSTHDPTFALKQMHAALDSLVIVLGHAFEPIMLAIIPVLFNIVQGISQFVMHHTQLVAIVASGAAIFLALFGMLLLIGGAIGLVMTAMAPLVGVLTSVAAPVLLLIAVLALLGAGLLLLAGYIIAAASHSKALQQVWNGEIVPAAKNVWSAISALAGILGKFWQEDEPKVAAAFSDLATCASKPNSPLRDFATMVQEATAAVLRFIQSPGFAGFVSAFISIFPGAVKITIDILKQLIDMVQLAAQAVFTTGKVVQDVSRGDWIGAANDIKSGWSDMSSTVIRLNNDIGQSVSDSTALGQSINNWNQYEGSIMQITNGIANNTTADMNRAADNTIAAWAKAHGESANEARKMQHEMVGGSIIPDMVSSVITWFAYMAIAAPAQMAIMAYSAVVNVYQMYSQMIGAMATVAGGMAIAGYNVGVSIGSGIVRGIYAMWGAVMAAANALASAAAATIRNALGTHSPSQVMVETVGIPIVQGIMKGMEVEFPTLKSGAESLMMQLAQALNAAVNSPNSTSSNVATNQQVNVNMNGDMPVILDGQVISRATFQYTQRQLVKYMGGSR